MCHDYAHPGSTNNFEDKMDSDLAICYLSDESPALESHHLAETFRLVQRSEFNFAREWPRSAFVEFRTLVVKVCI